MERCNNNYYYVVHFGFEIPIQGRVQRFSVGGGLCDCNVCVMQKNLDNPLIWGVVFAASTVTTLIHMCLLSDSGSYVLTVLKQVSMIIILLILYQKFDSYNIYILLKDKRAF